MQSGLEDLEGAGRLYRDELKTCIACKREKREIEFGKNPSRQRGLDPRCKECINEAVKLLIRTRKLAALREHVKRWQESKLRSEAEWLSAKLAVVTEVLQGQGSGRQEVMSTKVDAGKRAETGRKDREDR